MARPRGGGQVPPPPDELKPDRPLDVLQAQLTMRRSTVSKSGTRPSRTRCDLLLPGVLAAGNGVTNSAGQWTLSFSNRVLCGDEFEAEPVVVATVRGGTPALLTVSLQDISLGSMITIRSFKPDGTPTGGTSFSWHAISLLRSPGIS